MCPLERKSDKKGRGGMTKVRSVDFLSALGTFWVFGRGQVAESAADIISALGGSVQRHDGPVDAATIGSVSPSDVVICDVVERGVDDSFWETVGSCRTKVWVTVSAFGLDGPYGGRSGSDLVCSAAGGLLGAVADDDRRSYPLPGEQGLRITGQAAALAALHGISLVRERLSQVHLDVSAQESIAFCSVQQESAHLLYECTGRAGVSRYSSPSGHFKAADGDIEIVVLDDEQWRRISIALDRETWPADYPTLTDRQTHRAEIDQAVTDWTRTRSKTECEALLQAAGVPAVAVRTMEEVAKLEQFDDRGFLPGELGPMLRTAGLPASIGIGQESSNSVRDDPSLESFRVVEATNVLVGPLAGAMLGAMGSTVVRLENTNRLDIYRRNGPFQHGVPHPEAAAYFLVANYCKRSVEHDFEADQAYARRILDWGDLLLENVGEKVLRRIGLDEDRRKEADGHGLISISGFGRTGPCANFKAYAGNVHAFAGLDWVVGRISDSKGRVKCALADYCAAVWGATLAAAWWLGSRRPCNMDLSMAEVIGDKLNGSSLTTGYPESDEPTQDLLICCPDGGQVAVSTGGNIAPGEFIEAVGLDQGAAEQAPGARVLVLDLRADPAAPSAPELLDRISKAEVPVTAYPVQHPADIMTDDQLSARGFLVELEHPKTVRAPVLALPWKEAFTQRSGYQRAPLLGEHNQWMDTALVEQATAGREWG